MAVYSPPKPLATGDFYNPWIYNTRRIISSEDARKLEEALRSKVDDEVRDGAKLHDGEHPRILPSKGHPSDM